jgi:hypothetical protein
LGTKRSNTVLYSRHLLIENRVGYARLSGKDRLCGCHVKMVHTNRFLMYNGVANRSEGVVGGGWVTIIEKVKFYFCVCKRVRHQSTFGTIFVEQFGFS